MAVYENIDALLRRLTRRGLYTETINLYAEGIKAKLQASHFALENLKSECSKTDAQTQNGTTSQGVQKSLNTNDRVNFYCECFWDFLRSSFDILAQLVNELRSLNMNERHVDYKQMARKLESNEQGTSLEQSVRNCLRSTAFKNLEEYRHCSMHRRRVFIETRTHTISTTGTPDYHYEGANITTIERYLCNNPWDLQPRVDDNRPVVQYCERILNSLERRIGTIIGRLP